MADQNFALIGPPEEVTLLGFPLRREQRSSRGINIVTPPLKVVPIPGTERNQRSRTVVPIAGQSGGAPTPAVIHYQMSAARVLDGAYITWDVLTTPDTNGTSAPQPVVVASVSVVRRWVT